MKLIQKKMISYSKEVKHIYDDRKFDRLDLDTRSLSQDEANILKQWILKQFGDKIKNVKVMKIFLFKDKFHIDFSALDKYETGSTSMYNNNH